MTDWIVPEADRVASPNYSERKKPIRMIVIHTTICPRETPDNYDRVARCNGEPGRIKAFPGFGDFTRRQIFNLTTQIRVWADQIAFGRSTGEEDADD